MGQPAQFPYLADLRGLCGGSLVTPGRVLTAAHCIRRLRVGDRISIGPAPDSRRILHIAQDPRITALQDRASTTNRIFPYDVAILELDRPVTDVAPIRLAVAADAALYAPGALLTTIGRGATTRDGKNPGTLRFAQVQARSDADCRSLLGPLRRASSFVAATMLCTTDPDGRAPFRSGCFGDSGAPLVATAPDGTLVQVGVDDWGVACGFENGDPENYVEVPAIAGFALSPKVVYRPEPRGAPTFGGRAKVGSRVTCTPPVYASGAKPDRVKVGFFVLVGNESRLLSERSPYRVPSALRGRTISCAVSAHSKGGVLVTGARTAKRVAS